MDSLSFECKKEKEDIEYIDFLLEKKVDPTEIQINNKSALEIVFKKGKVNVLKKMIEFNVDVNVKDKSLNNFLHLLLKKSCSKEMVSFLIESGVGINDLNRLHVSPLMVACKNNKTTVDFLQFLVEKKANANIQNNKNRNLLHHFCPQKEGKNEILKYLISITEDIDQSDHSLFIPIEHLRDFENICTMLEMGSEKISHALLGYVSSKNAEKKNLEYLIEKKAEINFSYQDDSILGNACDNADFPLHLAKFLIEKKANLVGNNNFLSKLFSSRDFGDEDILFFEEFLDKEESLTGACENTNLNQKLIKIILERKKEKGEEISFDSFSSLSKNKKVSLDLLNLFKEYGATGFTECYYFFYFFIYYYFFFNFFSYYFFLFFFIFFYLLLFFLFILLLFIL